MFPSFRNIKVQDFQGPFVRHSAFEVLRKFVCLLILSFACLNAHAHIGSPDIFFDGSAGTYSVRVTIRMPGVVPGRAEITARVQTSDPVEVSFLPIFSGTHITNAPPAELAQLVRGETNLYSGELWLMITGGYSVEVRVKGPGGTGSVEIPVNSVATQQLPLPSVLGKILFALLALLVIGGIGIAAAAGREAALPAGATAGSPQRWKGVLAATVATIVFILALYIGKNWWASDERDFQSHLREGA